MTNDEGQVIGLVGISRDITELKNKEIEIRELSLRDQLTGLYNRRAFLEAGHQLLNTAQRNGKHVSLLYFDLDNFKMINDSFGHAKGDEVLMFFSKVLTTVCRSSEVIARLGGDEFVVLLASREPSIAAQTLIDRVNAGASQLTTEHPYLGISVGVATYPKDSYKLERLLEKADVQMYKDKKSRKSLKQASTA